jgi:predicted RNA-binding Zn-ribbon protein involved in translation (DUF1610 family)
MSHRHHAPLEKRTFKFKNPHMEFYCPLCGTQRAMTTNPHLSAMNYLQMTLVTVAITACLYPFMELKGIFSFFVVWACFEAALRLNFRKEVPCPHCGFDASWYKKDVKVAREKVDQFWSVNNADANVSAESNSLEPGVEFGEHTHQSEFATGQNYEEGSINY